LWYSHLPLHLCFLSWRFQSAEGYSGCKTVCAVVASALATRCWCTESSRLAVAQSQCFVDIFPHRVQAGREKQRSIMVANEEHARKLEMEYKEMKCEADRAQAKKEVCCCCFHCKTTLYGSFASVDGSRQIAGVLREALHPLPFASQYTVQKMHLQLILGLTSVPAR